MSFEVEVKYRTTGHADLARRLTALGAVPGPEITQEDAYLSHPAHDFARTNEALRLRRVGGSNRITYKGPRRDGPTKTREEIELPLGEGAESFERWLRLLTNLGFRPVAVIRKARRAVPPESPRPAGRGGARRGRGDRRVRRGRGDRRDEADLPAAQGAVLDLAGVLGLTDVEPRSYLRMALEQRSADRPPA